MPEMSRCPRVALNALLLSLGSDYRSAGIHRYIVELLGGLAETGELDLTAFAADPKAKEVVPPSIQVTQVPQWARRRVFRVAFEQLRLPALLDAADVDLLHGPAYALPVTSSVPAVVTVHDLSFFRLPGTLPPLQGAYLRWATRSAVRRASAVIAVSEFTAKELQEILGTDADKIHVVYNGVDEAFHPRPRSELRPKLRALGLEPGYLLAVATRQPRKNLGTLLDAYDELRRRRDGGVPDLVVVGPRGWGPRLQPPAGAHLLGFVAAETLPAVYGGARMLAYPSWYEGFGLPVAEAMASGVPVIVADASSLPEVAGGAALLVPADDVGGWADAIEVLLDDEDTASRLRLAGLTRAARFTWGRTARETLTVYREALRLPAGGAVPAAAESRAS